MRRIVIAICTTITGLVLLLSYPTSLNRSSFPALSTAGTAGTGAAAPSTAPAAGTTATFNGATASTRYGPVQVRITVAGGKLTAVDAIQLPSGNSYDEQVNQYAIPILTQEAIAQQSAKVSMVSGATYTSSGYLESLQSALDQARI